MRQAIALAAILVALFSSNVCAGGDLGVGVILGEPTGLSVKYWLDGDTAFGIRIPLGITHLFAEAPFDLFAEIVPLVDLTPDVDLDLNVAVGLRYYFR